MWNSYRVVWHDIVCDHHFGPEPDKVLFESNSLDECEKFKEEYLKKHNGFFTLDVQKFYKMVSYKWVSV